MPQRLRASLANAIVFRFLLNDLRLPLRLNVRQLQLLAQDLGQLFQRDIHFQKVPAARITARRPLSVTRIATLADRLAFFAVPLPYAARAVVAKPKMRHIERRHRYADKIPALPANHLAVRHIFSQILANPAADNLLEPP